MSSPEEKAKRKKSIQFWAIMSVLWVLWIFTKFDDSKTPNEPSTHVTSRGDNTWVEVSKKFAVLESNIISTVKLLKGNESEKNY